MKGNDDLKTALGQCFWIGVNGHDANEKSTREIFRTFQPGGVILFQRNVASYQQVKKLNGALQKMSSIPLLIAIDQEGGTVERLHEIIGTIPPAMAFVAAGSIPLMRRIHRAHARLLRSMGFNVNFTPVLDLALSDADNTAGTRCFSDDPDVITRWAREVVDAHLAEGVLTCGKHFPGLGDARLDTHIDLATVTSPWSKILNKDLAPYRELLNALAILMVNHALYPEKNDRMPASLSKEIVSDFLLKDWNYGGLAISDDLLMGAVSNFYTLPEAAERALLAGNHMALMCKPEGVVEAFEKLLDLVRSRPDLQSAVLRGCNRVLAFKFHHLKNQPATAVHPKKEIEVMRKAAELVSQKAVTLFKGQPFRSAPKTCAVFLPRNKWLKKAPSVLTRHLRLRGSKVTEVFYSIDLPSDEALSLAANTAAETAIVVVANTLRYPNQCLIAEELVRRKKQVAVISGAFPVDRFPEQVQIAFGTYWTSPAALEAAAQVLLGERGAPGILPLKV